MRRFFWDGTVNSGLAEITGTDARHMRDVLRMEAGERLIMCDGSGLDYMAEIVQSGRDAVAVKLLDKSAGLSEPSLDVTLCLAHTKGERLDFAVQKAVEIGAGRILLFRSERCITSGNGNKLTRLNRISREAAMQSGRSKIPEVIDIGGFSDALTASEGLKYFCYENETIRLSKQIKEPLSGKASLMFGPEGGFAESEFHSAVGAGWISVSLGARILRAETAPLVALTLLLQGSSDI